MQLETEKSKEPDLVLSRSGAAFVILLCLPGTLQLLLRSLVKSLHVGNVQRSGWLIKTLVDWDGNTFAVTLYFGLLLDLAAFVLTIMLTFNAGLSVRMKAILWVFLMMSIFGFKAATSHF